MAFEPRPRLGPASSGLALSAPPAVSGGRPGSCDRATPGAAAVVAAGTPAAAVRRVAEHRGDFRPRSGQPQKTRELLVSEEGAARFRALGP